MIFFSIIITFIIIISYIFAKFIMIMFFDVLYLSWLSKAVLNKNFEMRVKVRIWKK